MTVTWWSCDGCVRALQHLALEKNDPNRFMSANEPCNKSKNRYVNILPCECRVVPASLSRGGSQVLCLKFSAPLCS